MRTTQLSGEAVLLKSFGMAEVRLSQAGLPVTLTEPVTLRFPLFEERGLLPGGQIGLYSCDETSGRWQEEGTGEVVYQGGRATFQATVSHFSWWNADMPLSDTHCLEGQAVNDDGQGISGLTVEAIGEDYSGGSTPTTDGEGRFCANVKLGSRNPLQIYGGTPAELWEGSVSGVQAGTSPTDCSLGGCVTVGTVRLQKTSDRDQDGTTVLEGDCDDDNS